MSIKNIIEKGCRQCIDALQWRIKYYLVEPWSSDQRKPAHLLYKFFHFFPINKKLILFESEPDFCDNSWALYQYLKDNRPKYKFVWIVKDVQEFQDKVDGRISFMTRYGKGMHLKTLYYYATARWNFYTHWTFRPYQPRKGQTVVNLWHGSYPIKATKVKNVDYYDWLLSAGEEGKNELSKYLGCPMAKILPIGYPRIDLLIENNDIGKENPFCSSCVFQKLVIWMPTFRASINNRLSEDLCDTETGLPLFTTPADLTELNNELKQINVLILVKIHHLQSQKIVFKQNFSNIVIITDDLLAERGFQLYQILGKSDALITDYSSVTWDYLAVNKPIGFVLDDFEEYEKSCGFNIKNVKSVLKGEHIYKKQDFFQFLKSVLSGMDPYKGDRKKLVDQGVLAYPHGGNCKSIVDFYCL